MNSEFLKQMQELLGPEFPAYLNELEQPARRGLRVNPLKADVQTVFSRLSVQTEKSPYAYNGFYFTGAKGIGFTPEALAGLIYMQEPSASAAVTVLDPKPGMKVLDLCAAPGSKATQIAEILGHEGFLAANEINAKRAMILLENIERNGAANAAVLNSSPQEIADTFGPFFDAVLCDAPCSGEGMFRKSDDAVDMWSLENVQFCAKRQTEILHQAYRALKPGGVLVYSTCTLNTQENEENVDAFLRSHPDMHMEPAGVSFGRPGYPSGSDTEKAVRIFPMDGGEGHFIARMRKDGDGEGERKLKVLTSAVPKEAVSFLKDQLEKQYPYLYWYKDRIYGGTVPFYDLSGCRVLRNQVLLGEMKKGRFEPSHHFYTSAWSRFCHRIELNEEQCRRYLSGEQIAAASDKGWLAVCTGSAVLGGGKSDGTVIKNKYPKQYRLHAYPR